MKTRWMRTAGGLSFAGIALAATIGLAPTRSEAQEELRIGFITSMTGPLAQIGKDMSNGFELYLDEHNGMLGGAKVKFIVEDDQGKPPVAVLKAEKLIRQDKVHMISGGLLASAGYAIAPVSTREKVAFVISTSSADDLTQRQASQYPYVIRTSWTSSQPHHALGQYACEQGYKKLISIAADYAFGYEVVGGFQKTFEECGGQIVQKVWPWTSPHSCRPSRKTLTASFL